MALILLIRHAVTSMTGKRLYGRSEGITLSGEGREQAGALGERLRDLPLTALYASPLERCVETASAIAATRKLETRLLEGVLEIDYGRFTGRSFPALRRTKVWREIHGGQPSAVRFPGGETLAEAQRRSVDAVSDVAARHRRGTVAVVTHGDVISLVVAHFAGVHVDLFQRIEVAPASVSAISIGGSVPKIRRVNDTGVLTDLAPPRDPSRRVRG